jgi:hypothetical protein
MCLSGSFYVYYSLLFEEICFNIVSLFQFSDGELKPSGSNGGDGGGSPTSAVMSTTNSTPVIPVMSTIEMSDIAVSEIPHSYPL